MLCFGSVHNLQLGSVWKPRCVQIWIIASPRRPKAAPPMSTVALGSKVGSSLGRPEPPFRLVWSLLSSPSLIWNVVFSSFGHRLLQFHNFLIPRTKKGYKSPRKTGVFVVFSLGTQSSAWGGFWQSCIQIGMIFSRTTANSPQKVARQCLTVSQRTPRLRKILSKDAKELLKSAPVDL